MLFVLASLLPSSDPSLDSRSPALDEAECFVHRFFGQVVGVDEEDEDAAAADDDEEEDEGGLCGGGAGVPCCGGGGPCC
jgi:hypothetical protein